MEKVENPSFDAYDEITSFFLVLAMIFEQPPAILLSRIVLRPCCDCMCPV